VYNDNVSERRTQWEFDYLGDDLYVPACRRLGEVIAREEKTRLEAAERIRNADLPANDHRTRELRAAIEQLTTEREQLQVWVHEFDRHRQRSYRLGLGDVAYFRLYERNRE
jgi:hypothetical protein